MTAAFAADRLRRSLMTARATIAQTDLSVFPLNLGANVFGWTADKETSFDVLDAYVAAGGNFVDTADVYPAWVPGNSGGESEQIIGEWLAARGNRDDIVVATKVSQHPEFQGLSAENIRAAADASLARLQTDHIDLYYAHKDDPSVPLAETVGALSELVDAGKVRYIAISNYSAERVEEWLRVAKADGLHRAVALQPLYNLVERGYEQGLQQIAEREGLAVMPFSSLASGFLTGKYRDGSSVDSPRAGGASAYLDDRGRQVLATLDEVAAAHGASVTAVSLAWLAAQPTILAPLASARSVDQLPDLIASTEIELAADELAALDSASASVAASA
jgi:aryl-alcohol dehydrogenase-like predicted oxidoreductase